MLLISSILYNTTKDHGFLEIGPVVSKRKIDKIYCIGDSHVSFFSGYNKIVPLYPEKAPARYPFFEPYRLGAVLAYSLTNNNTMMKGREKLFELLNSGRIPRKSRILLCFGEIDCRAHLLRQAHLQKKKIEDVVDACLEHYFTVVREIKAMDFRPIVWTVAPPTESNNEEYPTYGTYAERQLVTEIFNRELCEKAVDHQIEFLSIYEYLITKEGRASRKSFFDDVHLSQRVMPFLLMKIRCNILYLLNAFMYILYWDMKSFSNLLFRKAKRIIKGIS